MKFFNKKKSRRACRVKKKSNTSLCESCDLFFLKMTRITASVKSKRFRHNINRKTYSFTVKYHYKNDTTVYSNSFVDYPTKEAAMRDCQRFEELLQKEGKIRGFKPIVLRQTNPVIQRDDEAPIAGTLQLQAQCYNNIVNHVSILLYCKQAHFMSM